MSDIKKLAAEMRKRADVLAHHGYRRAADEQRDDADALDAYAGAQEPVAWMDKWEKDYIIEASQFLPTADDVGHYIPLYAAPPLPSVSREKLREALRNNYSPDVSPEDIVEMALRAVGINVTEDGK